MECAFTLVWLLSTQWKWKRPLAPSLSLSLSPALLCLELLSAKWDSRTQSFLKFQIYNPIATGLYEITSSLQSADSGWVTFLCAEICELRNRTVSVPPLSLEEALHKSWEGQVQTTFHLRLRTGQPLSQHEQCHLNDDSFSRLVDFFYLLMDLFIIFLLSQTFLLIGKNFKRETSLIHKVCLTFPFVMWCH